MDAVKWSEEFNVGVWVNVGLMIMWKANSLYSFKLGPYTTTGNQFCVIVMIDLLSSFQLMSILAVINYSSNA